MSIAKTILGAMFPKLHFLALFRLILSKLGFKRTYLIQFIFQKPDGSQIGGQMIYVCKPWLTIYHMDQIRGEAAAFCNYPGAGEKVAVTAFFRMGNA
jgi:hypothetical protein